MNAKDIRILGKEWFDKNHQCLAELADGTARTAIYVEIAAQLAEANEHLAKIANPLIIVNAESPWVTLTWNGRSWVVDKREVASVSAVNDHQCVVVRRGEGGDDPGRYCHGTFSEVCTKLGIPTKERE